MKSETSPVFGEHRINVHHFGLERIEPIQPTVDQVVKKLSLVSATMDHYIFTSMAYMLIHPPDTGIKELLPDIVFHNQPPLLSLVVAEINGVDIECERFIDLSNVVIANSVKQRMDELRMEIKIHQQVFDAL
ncbi:hypothetical protein [Alistipes provencensis]|uniref:hypothetical protein n=1 Tax=Alistipes provencensis TaxID=1816676 RepID=UPI001F3F2838|nr:hypothetical protein [Alistipes provencensis]